MAKKILKYGELFCGPGGLAKGAQNVSVQSKGDLYVIRPIWAIDNDSSACKTFKKNIYPRKSAIINAEMLSSINGEEKRYVINDDIANVDFRKLPEIDVLAFGFPCNDFSLIGKMEGIEGKYGSLYKYGVEALKTLQPDIFIAENVSGLASKKQRHVLANIKREIESAGPGYNTTLHLYKLEEYGIPQTRHRIFIIGYKNKNIKFKVPKPSYNTVTAFEAIEEGKIYGEGPISSNIPNHNISLPHPRVQKRLCQTEPGENAWTAKLTEDVQLKGVKGAKFSSIYRKLKPDEPAYTVTGSGGGGTSMYHWTENLNKQRALTNRERARLQTFNDKFEFIGNTTQVRKQIGMAVPVKAAEIIFKSLLKSFLGQKYPHVSPNGSLILNKTENIF